MKRHTLSLVAFVIVLVAVFAACKKDDGKDGAVIGVVLNKNNAVLSAGDTLTLAHIVLPQTASNKNVTWTSANPSIANVVNGLITALAGGETTITVTSEDGQKTAVCKIVVNFSLGDVSFATRDTFIVGNQIWSDAVQATYCSDKTSYKGVDKSDPANPIYVADCRSNPGQKGDLFSWEMVNRFGNVLCPDGWRVPTEEDFVTLDLGLGGTGNFRVDAEFIRTKYLGEWGGELNGMTDGSLRYVGSRAHYWSQTQLSESNAIHMMFVANEEDSWNGELHVKGSAVEKADGHALRCVRDK
ncbi:MAG: Ig-like domain-containing protein [Bacteroidales bacterium]|jgi:uncharacterized protein (TIGR02145 family)|nr:Ig-like domain-containing protein [Bacteroidales bacterium]